MTVKARKATKQIVELEITEGALVDEGDNPEAHIVMVKASSSGDADAPSTPSAKDAYGVEPKTTAQILAERRFNSAFHEVKWAYMDAVSNIMYGLTPQAKVGPLLAKATAEFEEEVGELLETITKGHPDLVAHIKSLVDDVRAAASEDTPADEAKAAITKALDDLESIGAKEPPMSAKAAPTTPATPTPAPAAKSFDEILAALPEEQRAIVKAKVEADTKAAQEAAAKAAADEAAKSDVQKQLDAVSKKAAETEVELKALREEKLLAEFTAKARTIPGADVDKVAVLLKSAYGRSKEEGESLEQTLRAMGAQAAKGGALLKVIGSDANADGASAPDRLDAAAKAVMKEKPSLTYQQAYMVAAERNPDLYAEASRAG